MIKFHLDQSLLSQISNLCKRNEDQTITKINNNLQNTLIKPISKSYISCNRYSKLLKQSHLILDKGNHQLGDQTNINIYNLIFEMNRQKSLTSSKVQPHYDRKTGYMYNMIVVYKSNKHLI
ncbi:hypothetical protein pb186bvf_019791 [Paramecium bursaria]